MAQDAAATTNANQDIDIDELEVEILIVAKNPNNLKQTCAFLTRRGWPTTAHGNLSKAIEEVAEKRPDIVMISFNHPSPAVMKLPEIIAQTFNLVCVGFVENSDTASTSKLNNMKLRHKIFGTPSGPNFHRGIRRILAEKFNIKLDDKPGEKERESNSNVTIRGGAKADERVMQKSDADDTKKRTSESTAAYMPNHSAAAEGEKANPVAGDGPAKFDAKSSSGTGAQGPTSIMKPGHGSADPFSATQDGAAANEHAFTQTGTNDKSFKDAMAGKDAAAIAAAEAGAGVVQDAQGFADDGFKSASAERNDGLGSVTQMGMDAKAATQKALSGGGKRKKLKSLNGDARAVAGNLMLGENLDPAAPKVAEPTTPDLVGMLKKSLFEHGAEEEVTPQGVMEKAVEKAIGEVCRSNPDIQTVALKHVTKVGVFPIDSGVIPGYLVVALETGAAEDQKRFLRNCENALRGSFEALGVAGKLESGFWMDVPPVPFDQWAQNAGAFNFKLNHQGHEVGVSYFQSDKPIAKAAVSDQKDMFTVSLDQISTEEPVTFKAYLHLKENNKFYLYLRNGRQLQPEQKQRLEANDIPNVYMKSIDLENFRIFLASAFLKDTIRTTTSDAA